MCKDAEYLRTTFNASAEWYDRIRPGYPEALIDDVISLSALQADGRILEIGCGTGKATQMFASRGYSMVCLDIGTDLADVAAQKFREFPTIQILVSSFEEWEPDGRLFDLVMAATSFHWVDPSIAYVKTAAVLKPTGSLAVFSNTHIRQDEGFFLRVQEVYRAFAPSMMEAATSMKKRYGEPAATALFGEPIVRSYPWATEYSAKEYIDLLGTYSDHISLPPMERRDLFSGITDLIDREYGGRVLKHYETILRLQRKRQYPNKGLERQPSFA
jgi:ubiquinone/menaquinone biosynthesis C-methylase UbiE